VEIGVSPSYGQYHLDRLIAENGLRNAEKAELNTRDLTQASVTGIAVLMVLCTMRLTTEWAPTKASM